MVILVSLVDFSQTTLPLDHFLLDKRSLVKRVEVLIQLVRSDLVKIGIRSLDSPHFFSAIELVTQLKWICPIQIVIFRITCPQVFALKVKHLLIDKLVNLTAINHALEVFTNSILHMVLI